MTKVTEINIIMMKATTVTAVSTIKDKDNNNGDYHYGINGTDQTNCNNDQEREAIITIIIKLL